MAERIKAIETSYNGYRFRSRLEARWAVFFDAMGVAFEYEKEGYTLPSGAYLPDFWIPLAGVVEHPGAGYWVEIKPTTPTEQEIDLLLELTILTGHHGFLLFGNVGLGEFDVLKTFCCRSTKALDYWVGRKAGPPHVFTEFGDRVDLPVPLQIVQLDMAPDRAGVLLHREPDDDPWDCFLSICELVHAAPCRETPHVEVGIRAARSARFEHGQSGARRP